MFEVYKKREFRRVKQLQKVKNLVKQKLGCYALVNSVGFNVIEQLI